MSLKDEIEKLIQSEKSKLEQRDKKHEEFFKRHEQRFAPLRVVIEELVASVDSNYIRTHISSYFAWVEVGWLELGYKTAEIKWHIEPHYDTNIASTKKGESQYLEKPGFRVEESSLLHTAEHIFNTEQEVAQYLIEKVAENVASYRHSEEKHARNEKEQD